MKEWARRRVRAVMGAGERQGESGGVEDLERHGSACGYKWVSRKAHRGPTSGTH